MLGGFMNLIIKSKYLFALLLMCPLLAFALPSDKQKPASISSDTATLNRSAGTGIFIGHVIVKQGTTQIQANKLLTYTLKSKKIKKGTAFF